MFQVIAIAALLSLNVWPDAGAAQVRISLFGLFKPEVVHARIVSGEGATIEVDGRGDRRLEPGDTLRLRLAGDRVNIVIGDRPGGAGQPLLARVARIVPARSTALELILPGKIKRVVRGEIFVSPGERDLQGQLKIVLATDRESAVASVVAAELSGERAAEAFKALAVVVRTFMLAHPGRHGAAGFDFCDTTHCQLYRGEQDLATESASPVIASAVAATTGEVLSFGGRPIESYYTASCGGLSATPEMVWGGASQGYSHRRVICHWCRGHRYYRWKRSADVTAIVSALSVFLGERLSSSTAIAIDNDPASRFVRSVTLRDGSAQCAMSADAFRRAIGHKLGWNTALSPSFTIERRGARFILRGRGFGSQVGLCLAGLVAQAATGRSYREILSFYFSGAEVSDGFPRD